MKSILNFYVNHDGPFQPTSMKDLLAVRIAHKLGDEALTGRYADLASQYSPAQFLGAYRRAAKSGSSNDLRTQFHAELRSTSCRTSPYDDVRLIAIKVERRSIAAAVFIGQQLEHIDVRHLSSQAKRAESSAIEFVTHIATGFDVESAAIESRGSDRNIRRAVLSNALVESCIQSHAIPLWEMPKKQLLEAFGYPPLRSRKQLREVILSMWPILDDRSRLVQVLDAVALGAFVQVERLFLINSHPT